ncbi:MAG: hypothetical protein AAF458_21715 [Pseudomonadota bacterium]
MQPWHTPTSLPLERKPERSIGGGCAILAFATPFSLVGITFFSIGVFSGPGLFAFIGGIFTVVGLAVMYAAIGLFRGPAWFSIDRETVRARDGTLRFARTYPLRAFNQVDVLDAEDDDGEGYFSVVLVHPSAEEPDIELAANRRIEVAFELAEDYAGLLLFPGPDGVGKRTQQHSAPAESSAFVQLASPTVDQTPVDAPVVEAPVPEIAAPPASAVVVGHESFDPGHWSDDRWLELISADTPDPALVADACAQRIAREPGFGALRTREGLRVDARPVLSLKFAVGLVFVGMLFGAVDAFAAAASGVFGWLHLLEVLFPFVVVLGVSMVLVHGLDQVLAFRRTEVIVRTRLLGFTLHVHRFGTADPIGFRAIERMKFFKGVEIVSGAETRQFGWCTGQLSAESVALCARIYVGSATWRDAQDD